MLNDRESNKKSLSDWSIGLAALQTANSGVARSKSQNINSPFAIIDLIENDLPARCIESLMKSSGLAMTELSQLLQITEASSDKKFDGVLAPLQSAQLFLIAYLFAKAHDIFGDRGITNTWLRQRQRGLHQCVSLEMLRTPVGIHVVIQFLEPIDHGVYV